MDEFWEARALDDLVLATRVERLGDEHPGIASAQRDRDAPLEAYWRFCAQSNPLAGAATETIDLQSSDDEVILLESSDEDSDVVVIDS